MSQKRISGQNLISSNDSKGGTKILINLKPLYSYWLREKNYRRKPGITD